MAENRSVRPFQGPQIPIFYALADPEAPKIATTIVYFCLQMKLVICLVGQQRFCRRWDVLLWIPPKLFRSVKK